MTFSISTICPEWKEPTVKFSTQKPLAALSCSSLVPAARCIMVIAYLPGKDLEIHTADFPPTTRGTLVKKTSQSWQDDLTRRAINIIELRKICLGEYYQFPNPAVSTLISVKKNFRMHLKFIMTSEVQRETNLQNKNPTSDKNLATRRLIKEDL
ncbi:hypothetical protein O9992_26425 [Vibrio lentus]|nr:hypothetical protein [Vibrio lentus]